MKVYQFCLRCHLGPSIIVQFPEFSVRPQPNGTTMLVGPLPDQSALHGVLARIRDLGLPLIAFNQQVDQE